ncbi:MAG: LysM peptidoglycan-binding domain-containing protein, partial [Bacteroidota bacterium]
LFPLFALFFLATTSLVAQQQTFVLYEPGGCMLRVEYEQAIAQQPKIPYYAYQVSLADGNKLILETGAEGNVRQNYLPNEYLRCNDPRLNAQLAEAINSNQTKVFLLVKEGNDYLIQPVSMAAIFAKQGNLLTYVSPLASFQFDIRNAIIGENLAYNNPKAKVFFEGRENSPCEGNYLIRQLMPRNAYPVIDFKMNPELGVVQRRLGDGQNDVGGSTTARAVNGQELNAYLATACSQGTVAAAPGNPAGPITYGSTPVSTPQQYGAGTVASPQPYAGSTPTNNPNPPATSAPDQGAPSVTTHQVAKGETLYGLSRRYSATVEQLREWNNLGSNTINVGQELRVSAPAVAFGNPPTNVQSNRGPVAASNPGSAQPVPYGGAPAQPQQAATEPVTTPADQQHIVQPGET